MFSMTDIPIIIALFAAIFGVLGFVSVSIPGLRRNIPNLTRGSILYLVSSALLFAGVYFKQDMQSTPKSESELAIIEASLAGPSVAKNLQIHPVVNVVASQPVGIEAKLDVSISSINISLISDPIGADVFVYGRLRGKTPLTLSLVANKLAEYRVTASPDAETGICYEPFKGFIHQDESSEISVWLERIY